MASMVGLMAYLMMTTIFQTISSINKYKSPKHHETHPHPPSPSSTSGFTLVEMILVLAIVALLVGAAVVNFGGVLEGGKKTTSKGHISSITSALRAYEVDNMFLPTTSKAVRPRGKTQRAPGAEAGAPSSKSCPSIPGATLTTTAVPARRTKAASMSIPQGRMALPDNADDIGSWDI
jgi:general secretion pathway protein G